MASYSEGACAERFSNVKQGEGDYRVKQGLKLRRTAQPSVLDCCAVLHGIMQKGLYAIHQFKSSMLVGEPTGQSIPVERSPAYDYESVLLTHSPPLLE